MKHSPKSIEPLALQSPFGGAGPDTPPPAYSPVDSQDGRGPSTSGQQQQQQQQPGDPNAMDTTPCTNNIQSEAVAYEVKCRPIKMNVFGMIGQIGPKCAVDCGIQSNMYVIVIKSMIK